MIFVLLGTQDAPFTRLTDLVRTLAESANWQEPIIIQSGKTRIAWGNPNVHVVPFFEKEVFQTHFQDARLIITHGGAGTLFEAMAAQKKTIVIPRLYQFGEHVDNHQLELTTLFAEQGYVEMYREGALETLISTTENKTYRIYQPNHTLIEHIQRRLR